MKTINNYIILYYWIQILLTRKFLNRNVQRWWSSKHFRKSYFKLNGTNEIIFIALRFKSRSRQKQWKQFKSLKTQKKNRDVKLLWKTLKNSIVYYNTQVRTWKKNIFFLEGELKLFLYQIIYIYLPHWKTFLKLGECFTPYFVCLW